MSNTDGPEQSTSDGQEEGTAERYARLLARVQRQNLLSNGLFLHYDGEIEDLRCFLWYMLSTFHYHSLTITPV